MSVSIQAGDRTKLHGFGDVEQMERDDLGAANRRHEDIVDRCEGPASAPPFTGTLETDRYVARWRELETGRVWEIPSPQPEKGADLVHVEVRIRLGDYGRVVQWAGGGAQSPEIRTLAEVARRVLAAGRGAAFER